MMRPLLNEVEPTKMKITQRHIQRYHFISQGEKGDYDRVKENISVEFNS